MLTEDRRGDILADRKAEYKRRAGFCPGGDLSGNKQKRLCIQAPEICECGGQRILDRSPLPEAGTGIFL